MAISLRLRAVLPLVLLGGILPSVSAAPAADTAKQAEPPPVISTPISSMEDKITTAKSLKITSSTSGTLLPAGSPLKIEATMERPSSLRLIITRDGKNVGTVVTGPNGGYVYDAAGNRYLKAGKGATAQENVRNVFEAADAILPNGTLLSMFSTVAFLMKPHPLQMPPTEDLKTQTTATALHGVTVTQITQSGTFGPSTTISDVYVSKDSGMPVRLSLSGKSNGQPTGTMVTDFEAFTVGDELPASTFDYTPPASVKLYVPPAQKHPAAPAPAAPK